MATKNAGNTIFMTPEESERIRQTIQNRLRRCGELKGQPRPSGANRNLVATASFLADVSPDPENSNDSGDALPAYGIGSTYPPCETSLADLKPIVLSDLCFETRYPGRVLTVRRASPVVRGKVTSWTVVKDEESEEIERLELVLHKSSADKKEILETGDAFAIKEPYLTLNDEGSVAIRIVHPSDLVVRTAPTGERDQAPLKPGISRHATPEMLAQCKDQGNAALKNKELWRAYESYSEGLQLTPKERELTESLRHDLHRNRAHLNLLLGRHDEAKTDGLAAVTSLPDPRSQDLDSKAYFRAACAAYNLGQFEEAKEFYEKQKMLAPEDKGAAAGLQNTLLRLREQSTGTYNWKKIKAGLSKARPRADTASYICNTEVKDSPGRGHGLFATQPFHAGQVVLVEKAFSVVWAHEKEAWTAMTYDTRDDHIRAFPAGLTKAVVQKLLGNPSQVETVLGLFGDYSGTGQKAIVRDGGSVIDTFQVHDIVARNAFGAGPQYGEENVRRASTGLWVQAAYANHSCLPNIEKEFIGDLMIMKAKSPIAVGEEIFNCYDQSADYQQRTAALERTWGFKCSCSLCKAEESDSAEVRGQRRNLELQAQAFIEREDAGSAKRLTVAKAERLTRAINETYNADRFKGLPRRATEGIDGWIQTAKRTR